MHSPFLHTAAEPRRTLSVRGVVVARSGGIVTGIVTGISMVPVILAAVVRRTTAAA